MQPHADVVIVGAGLSGLTAAHELQKAGVSCLVLEARDRVGGKTWSVHVDPLNENKVVDVGAAWINDTNQSEVYALARELGLELVVQNTAGKVVQEDIQGALSTFEYGGAPGELSEVGGVDEMIRVRQLFEDTCQQVDIRNADANDAKLDSMSLHQWIESQSKSKTALASASVWTRAMLGLEPSEVSALHFLNYCKSGGGLLQMRKDTKDGGQYLRFAKGTQALSHGLAARLKPGSVHLSCPVGSISQSEPGNAQSNIITVTTSTTPPQSFTSNQLILTLPTPLYQTIHFSPPLPPLKAELSRRTVAGYTNKIILLYATPFWRRAGLCGLLQSFIGPITVTRDSSVDSTDQYSLTCFLVGAIGRHLSTLPQQERFDSIIQHVHRVFSPFCAAAGIEVEKPIAVAEYEWTKDEWSRGCPVPVFPPGVMSVYERELRTGFGAVLFAGTETSFEWKGYMDGAVRSGKRAAGRVTGALEGSRGDLRARM